MGMIKRLEVMQYRGIKDLYIDSFNRFNLIVGDNNCGKTSLLEAIQLFRAPNNIANVYKIARLRNGFNPFMSTSTYDNFIFMFPQDKSKMRIEVACQYDDKEIGYNISGHKKSIMVDEKELKHNPRYQMTGEIETEAFEGEIVFFDGEKNNRSRIDISRLDRMTGIRLSDKDNIRIQYVSPCAHLGGSVINQIVKNDDYKRICLMALNLFDENIIDLRIYKNDIGNMPVEYVKHRILGDMPLSAFGDGIKKVLLLANSIASAKNGILLIDEIETSIHKKYYDDIFQFVIIACRKFNVQVFITTHSLEAIDGLLATQHYEDESNQDDISVVTLKNTEETTYSRVLSGREVYENRENFGFEVRL